MWLSLLFPCGLKLQGSLPSHSLRLTQTTHKKKQVGLCHFNDSIAFGVLYRLCSVTQQRPMWRAPAPPPWIRPHSDESRRGHLHPLTRRGCWRGLEDYFIGLFLQRHDLFVRIFHERGFKSQENISWKKKKKKTQRHAVFCRRSDGGEIGGQTTMPARTHVILSHP